MSKYLVTWESNLNMIPSDPQERIAMNMKMLEATKQNLQQFAPYIIFNVQEVMSVDEALDALKSMMG